MKKYEPLKGHGRVIGRMDLHIQGLAKQSRVTTFLYEDGFADTMLDNISYEDYRELITSLYNDQRKPDMDMKGMN